MISSPSIGSVLLFSFRHSSIQKKSGPRTHPPNIVVATTLTRFTNSLLKIFMEYPTTNEAVLGRLSSSWYTILVSGSKYDCCTVAPKRESRIDPTKPHVSENKMILGAFAISIPERKSIRIVDTPIMAPPMALQKNPFSVTPPLVPEGTCFQGWVMSRGLDLLRIPISLARVSARQVAWWAMMPHVNCDDRILSPLNRTGRSAPQK